MKYALGLLLMISAPLFAENKTCGVKGMHCESCVSSVKEKVCAAGEYSECEVKITDAKKKSGEIVLKTKDAKAKVDEKAVHELVADAGYQLQKCKAL